jgi:hypothetical protein
VKLFDLLFKTKTNLFNVNVDEAAESTDVILNKRGDEPRFVVSSRQRNVCKRYQCGLSSTTFGSK